MRSVEISLLLFTGTRQWRDNYREPRSVSWRIGCVRIFRAHGVRDHSHPGRLHRQDYESLLGKTVPSHCKIDWFVLAMFLTAEGKKMQMKGQNFWLYLDRYYICTFCTVCSLFPFVCLELMCISGLETLCLKCVFVCQKEGNRLWMLSGEILKPVGKWSLTGDSPCLRCILFPIGFEPNLKKMTVWKLSFFFW